MYPSQLIEKRQGPGLKTAMIKGSDVGMVRVPVPLSPRPLSQTSTGGGRIKEIERMKTQERATVKHSK
jgi:hypothetical protein